MLRACAFEDNVKGRACFAHIMCYFEFYTTTFKLKAYCMNSDDANEDLSDQGFYKKLY